MFFSPPHILPVLPRGRAGITEAMEVIGEGLRAHVDYAVELTGVALPGDEGTR